MKAIKRLYEKTGSLGHLMLWYCFLPFLFSSASIFLHLVVWEKLPEIELYQAILFFVVVKVSEAEYRLKQIAKNLKGTN